MGWHNTFLSVSNASSHSGVHIRERTFVLRIRSRVAAIRRKVECSRTNNKSFPKKLSSCWPVVGKNKLLKRRSERISTDCVSGNDVSKNCEFCVTKRISLPELQIYLIQCTNHPIEVFNVLLFRLWETGHQQKLPQIQKSFPSKFVGLVSSENFYSKPSTIDQVTFSIECKGAFLYLEHQRLAIGWTNLPNQDEKYLYQQKREYFTGVSRQTQFCVLLYLSWLASDPNLLAFIKFTKCANFANNKYGNYSLSKLHHFVNTKSMFFVINIIVLNLLN